MSCSRFVISLCVMVPIIDLISTSLSPSKITEVKPRIQVCCIVARSAFASAINGDVAPFRSIEPHAFAFPWWSRIIHPPRPCEERSHWNLRQNCISRREILVWTNNLVLLVINVIRKVEMRVWVHCWSTPLFWRVLSELLSRGFLYIG